MLKKILVYGLTICLLFSLTACSSKKEKDDKDNDNSEKTETNIDIDYSNDWTDNKEGLIDASILNKTNEQILFTEEDKDFSINKGGVYLLSGTYNDTILVDTEDEVTLILDNLTVNSYDASIIVLNTSKCNIYVKENTVNTFTDLVREISESEEDYDAVIYSKSDLYISGNGKLVINANYKDGLVSKDNLVLGNTRIDVTAIDDGIVGKDSISIYGADISLTSENNGLKTDNIDEGKGFIYIESGLFNIETKGDAISSDTNLTIIDGEFNITTYKDTEDNKIEDDLIMNEDKSELPEEIEIPEITIPEDIKDENDMESDNNFLDRVEGIDNDFNKIEMPQRPNGDMPSSPGFKPNEDNGIQRPNQDFEIPGFNDSSEEDDISRKGLKAGTNLVIKNGSFNLEVYDDAIHSDGDVLIEKGIFVINSFSEGIEGINVVINDGEFNISTYDDGINAEETITINNGQLFIDASNNDAIDANGSKNGSVTINNGIVIALGGEAPEGAFDNDNNAIVINGGYIFGFGGASTVLDNSNQQFISLNGKVSNSIELRNNNKILYVFEINKNLGNGEFFISVPELNKESTYSLYIDGKLFKDNLSVSENSSNMGGFGGFFDNDFEKDEDKNLDDGLIGDFIFDDTLV